MVSGNDANYTWTIDDVRKLDETLNAIKEQNNTHNLNHKKDLRDIKKDIRENTKATKSLADHVAKQNGRVTKLEAKKGSGIQFDNKTITMLAVAAIVFMVLVVAGKEGLGLLQDVIK